MTQESSLIDELIGKYEALPDDKKAEIDRQVEERSQGRLWFPTPGPQLDAVNCQADVLLYGGSGGSGKTDLILGLAHTEHQKTLIIRKFYTDLTGLTDRAIEINGTDKGYNGSKPRSSAPNILDRSSIDLSLLFGIRQLRISFLMALADEGLIAGINRTNLRPCRSTAVRNLNS